MGDKLGLAKTHNNIAKVLLALERKNEAVKNYEKSYELYFKLGLYKDYITILMILYQLTENKDYLIALAQIIHDASDEVKQEFIKAIPEIEEFLK